MEGFPVSLGVKIENASSCQNATFSLATRSLHLAALKPGNTPGWLHWNPALPGYIGTRLYPAALESGFTRLHWNPALPGCIGTRLYPATTFGNRERSGGSIERHSPRSRCQSLSLSRPDREVNYPGYPGVTRHHLQSVSAGAVQGITRCSAYGSPRPTLASPGTMCRSSSRATRTSQGTGQRVSTEAAQGVTSSA